MYRYMYTELDWPATGPRPREPGLPAGVFPPTRRDSEVPQKVEEISIYVCTYIFFREFDFFFFFLRFDRSHPIFEQSPPPPPLPSSLSSPPGGLLVSFHGLADHAWRADKAKSRPSPTKSSSWQTPGTFHHGASLVFGRRHAPLFRSSFPNSVCVRGRVKRARKQRTGHRHRTAL